MARMSFVVIPVDAEIDEMFINGLLESMHLINSA